MQTHAELVTLGERWLRKHSGPRYTTVLADVRCNMIGEQPDAIGWTSGGKSCLLEAKTSRSDFTKDAKKYWRKYPSEGMGVHRYYIAPAGVLKPSEMPEYWGLLEVGRLDGKIWCARTATTVDLSITALREEKTLLLSALRRATEGWGRRMFGEKAPPIVDGDPSKTTGKVLAELRAENGKLRALVRHGERLREKVDPTKPRVIHRPTTEQLETLVRETQAALPQVDLGDGVLLAPANALSRLRADARIDRLGSGR